MSKNTFIETIGWVGVVLVVGAYALNTLNVVTNTSLVYLLGNAFGATCIAIDSLKDKNYQPVVLNVIWFFIALIGLVQGVV